MERGREKERDGLVERKGEREEREREREKERERVTMGTLLNDVAAAGGVRCEHLSSKGWKLCPDQDNHEQTLTLPYTFTQIHSMSTTYFGKWNHLLNVANMQE